MCDLAKVFMIAAGYVSFSMHDVHSGRTFQADADLEAKCLQDILGEWLVGVHVSGSKVEPVGCWRWVHTEKKAATTVGNLCGKLCKQH